jgi:hypothetical protein
MQSRLVVQLRRYTGARGVGIEQQEFKNAINGDRAIATTMV